MAIPFIAREVLDTGRLTRHQLRTRHAVVYPGVYAEAGVPLTARDRAKAAWLWSKRRGILAGRSAAAMHGSKWLDASLPAEILYNNRHAPPGVRTWADAVEDDEITMIDGIPVTSPARTALDMACRYPLNTAVTAIDALANAARLKSADIEMMAERHRGRRGIPHARKVLELVDPGAESPKETWLRLLVIRNGYRKPTTQIPVYDEYGVLVAVLDMGWEDMKLALDYEGEHHRNPVRFNKDIRRHDAVTQLGWTDIRVTSLDTEGVIIGRLSAAWNRVSPPALSG